ncbi:MAG: P1 family peptidase [Saprospiraceae bacterium]|nr:P1 family peptidase [Saprospiraceae bacterium]
MNRNLFILIALLMVPLQSQSQGRPRDLGIKIGVMQPGPLNAITDVGGVKVGHVTLVAGDHIRTGVTAILPHDGNLFQEKVPAAIHVGNGFGKLAGSTQVEELGTLETPVILTNTLSVPTAADALIGYTLAQKGNETVRSVNSVVGETNDGRLNDIRGRHVTKQHVLDAINTASGGPVAEGNVGAGTGTICFGFKGGMGTASRRLPASLGGYTVGVLVQTNFGGVLRIDGHPVGEDLEQYAFRNALENGDGSCMIVVATDAPVDVRNLKRMARRAMLGLGNTGGISSNGSGDYVIAFSTYEENRVPYAMGNRELQQTTLHNDSMSPLFMATIEATEEAIINSLFAAETMTGNGHTVEALPAGKVLEMMRK